MVKVEGLRKGEDRGKVAETSRQGLAMKPIQKAALVTGSGKRRVGAYVADALAERGFSLVIHYRQSEKEAEVAVARYVSRGVNAVALQADLTDEKATLGLISQTLAQFGRIDVLVNCAAIWDKKPLEDVTAADVSHYFETNTLSTFLCSQKAGLAMTQQKEGGSIITIGDWATQRPYQDHAAYFISKGTIPTMTRMLAVELAAQSCRARQLHPPRSGAAAA